MLKIVHFNEPNEPLVQKRIIKYYILGVLVWRTTIIWKTVLRN